MHLRVCVCGMGGGGGDAEREVTGAVPLDPVATFIFM